MCVRDRERESVCVEVLCGGAVWRCCVKVLCGGAV